MFVSDELKKGVLKLWKMKSSMYDTMYFYGDEGEWDLDPFISDYVLHNMPDDLSVEDKGLFVYFKMCELFSYNINYIYHRMERFFRKSVLESISKDSTIVCWDFARIYSKLIDMIGDKQIYGVVLDSKEDIFNEHMGVGMVTAQGIVEFEPMAININENRLSDLTNAKMKFPLTNIKVILGNQDSYNKKIKDMNQMFGYTNDASSFLQHFVVYANESGFDNSIDRLSLFISDMRQRNIIGQEFIYLFSLLNRKNCFNGSLEHQYIGEFVNAPDEDRELIDEILIKHGQNQYIVDTLNHSCLKTSDELLEGMFLERKIGRRVVNDSIDTGNCKRK